MLFEYRYHKRWICCCQLNYKCAIHIFIFFYLYFFVPSNFIYFDRYYLDQYVAHGRMDVLPTYLTGQKGSSVEVTGASRKLSLPMCVCVCAW